MDEWNRYAPLTAQLFPFHLPANRKVFMALALIMAASRTAKTFTSLGFQKDSLALLEASHLFLTELRYVYRD